jgi:hypothetical protein
MSAARPLRRRSRPLGGPARSALGANVSAERPRRGRSALQAAFALMCARPLVGARYAASTSGAPSEGRRVAIGDPHE